MTPKPAKAFAEVLKTLPPDGPVPPGRSSMSSAPSTAYLVEITANAVADLESVYGSIDAENSQAATRWFNRLEEVIFSLDRLPSRGVRTPEDPNLRQLLYGNKPHVYRIIYEIDGAGHRVLILHIRHGARSAFQSQDIRPPTA